MSGSTPLRLLVVEDVPQVAQYVRGLIAAQGAIKLVDVVADGSKAMAQVQQLRPDVVLVDWLLQGRIRGSKVVQLVRDSGLGIPVIVLTVPQNPVQRDPEAGIAAVLAMPFSGFELVNLVAKVHQVATESSESRLSHVTAVFAPKGGVGKTTVAFNLAVAVGRSGARVVLVDGSLQYGDLRSLLKVPDDAPSLLDLPTDRIGESDLADVLWRDPSGIDILLAPPRVEMAEMVTVRDIDKVFSILRRVYDVVIVDMPMTINDVTLAILDGAETILEIVTYDSTTIRNTLAMAEAFKAIGYAPGKVLYVVNRSDSTGGISPDELAQALGRAPDYSIVSDGRLVVQSNNAGVPFVLANPDAPISHDIDRLAAAIHAPAVPAGARR